MVIPPQPGTGEIGRPKPVETNQQQGLLLGANEKKKPVFFHWTWTRKHAIPIASGYHLGSRRGSSLEVTPMLRAEKQKEHKAPKTSRATDHTTSGIITPHLFKGRKVLIVYGSLSLVSVPNADAALTIKQEWKTTDHCSPKQNVCFVHRNITITTFNKCINEMLTMWHCVVNLCNYDASNAILILKMEKS